MNDADIIKALECCFTLGRCEDCPMYADGWFSQSRNACRAKLMGDSLDLINRQKEEIERLQGYNENLLTANTALSNEILDIKSESIKEFAERLRNKFFNYYDGLTENTSKSCHNGDSLMFYEVADMIVDCIDNLVKEMTEDKT